MPLVFNPPADPLTLGAQSQTPPSVSHVIESDALTRLTREIERYGRRELAGRSILIAGHRGIGKTTLVRKAIENARGSRSQFAGRPLFVDLHGPDLLAPPEKQTSEKKENTQPADTLKSGDGETPHTDKGGEQKLADTKLPSGPDLESFVERLTFSLYRAAAKEFVESFRNLRGLAEDSTHNEYSELAEQFALELDGSTDLGRVRLLYERVGAFAEGVLKTLRASTGSQELALLAASSQCYRIVSGKLDEERSQENTGSNKVTWSIAADNLLSPITGLLTGGLVWAALPSDSGPLAKLFTSFTTGLASAVAVKWTRTIQRESKQTSKVTFVPQSDKLALRRLLPVLVDRFCDVGLPPIFVVDELDKVPDISERMQSLMGFLKQFVTERAFFCFLADREYYERLEARVLTSAFPIEATLFGDRLFVQYKPEAAHAYLKNVTKVENPTIDYSQDDAARDIEVLSYVLLRRSYMHPFDLRREIARSTNVKNEFRFPPRALFNVPQYRNEVYYQVAVECVLAREKMMDFTEEPNRAQLLYDALYFPIRTKRLPEEFDASLESLQRHLAARMGNEDGKLENQENLDIVYESLTELVGFLRDPRVLRDTVYALAAAKYLPEPKVFPPAVVGVIEAAAGPAPAVVSPSVMAVAAGGSGTVGVTETRAYASPVAPASTTEATSQSPDAAGDGARPSGTANDPASAGAPRGSSPPLTAPTKSVPLLEHVGGERYRWRFDRYGYPVDETAGLEKAEVIGPEAAAGSGAIGDLLSDFYAASELVTTMQGTSIDIELWEQMRLIPTPPTWSYLTEAAAALRNPVSLPATKVAEYTKALTDYRSNLQWALGPIWQAVAIAATAAIHGKSGATKTERRWLQILAEVLAEATSRDQMLKQLADIAKEAPSGDALGSVPGGAGYRVMLDAIEASASTVRQRPEMAPSDVAPQSGNFYENWFIQFYSGNRPKIDSLWPFLSLAMGSLPLGLKKINPLRMTIGDWNESVRKPQNVLQKAVSQERLGFRQMAAKVAGMIDPNPDSLLQAVAQSIRKRGYEKAAVILVPLPPESGKPPQSLTEAWLPSENVACWIGLEDTTLEGTNLQDTAKYILVEGTQNVMADSATPRLAFFGASPIPQNFSSYPFVPDPQSLDDLVERLDAKPLSDWPTRGKGTAASA